MKTIRIRMVNLALSKAFFILQLGERRPTKSQNCKNSIIVASLVVSLKMTEFSVPEFAHLGKRVILKVPNLAWPDLTFLFPPDLSVFLFSLIKSFQEPSLTIIDLMIVAFLVSLLSRNFPIIFFSIQIREPWLWERKDKRWPLSDISSVRGGRPHQSSSWLNIIFFKEFSLFSSGSQISTWFTELPGKFRPKKS